MFLLELGPSPPHGWLWVCENHSLSRHCCHWLPLHWPAECLAPKFAHILMTHCSGPTGYLSLDIIELLVSVLYLVYMIAVPFYVPDSRDVSEEGWTKIVRVMQDTWGGVYDQAFQDGCSLALYTSPAWPVPASPTPAHMTGLPTYCPLPHPVFS